MCSSVSGILLTPHAMHHEGPCRGLIDTIQVECRCNELMAQFLVMIEDVFWEKHTQVLSNAHLQAQHQVGLSTLLPNVSDLSTIFYWNQLEAASYYEGESMLLSMTVEEYGWLR